MYKNQKNVLVMCIANPSKNPRPNRIINLLTQQGFEVDTVAYKSNGDLKISNEYIIKELSLQNNERIKRLLLKIWRLIIPSLSMKIRITEKLYNLAETRIDFKKYDLIIVENIEMLPLAINNKLDAKVLCDLREFYPLEYENSFLFRILESKFKINICKQFLNQCDELITVSTGLIKGYEGYFNIKPKLLMSTPNYNEIKPTTNHKNQARMVHHGAANIDRKLENMIELFHYLDERFSLDFYLVGNQSYIDQLKEIAKPFPQIRFLEPVAFNNIILTMNQYDIGLYLLEPTGFNTKYALPNKFFEYIQARLMLATGPSLDMKNIIESYKLGIVSKSFKPIDLATKLNKISSSDIIRFKQNSNSAAKEFCYENESKKLLTIFNNLLD